MLVPLSWLREYVEWDLSVEELAEVLTLAGLEVTHIERIGDWWDRDAIRVGRITGVHAHPNADRLVLVDVDDGAPETERVVTGAPNVVRYRDVDPPPTLKVAFARAGAVLVDAYAEDRPRPRRKLKRSKIRGVRSNGMVCSELELGLSEEHEGILELPADAPVGQPLTQYLRDEVLELDLTPDMARGLSMVGVAREVAALTGGALRTAAHASDAARAAGEPAHARVELDIADADLCSRYAAMVIEEIEVGPSPAWMQQRLLRAGMRPINNIVDITNYVMLEWGQPLHAFDLALLERRSQEAGSDRPRITIRTARSGETLRTLDDVERELTPEMLLITDALGPIAIAGVMGGADTEVSEATTSILLESATFEGINNRRTAQALRLHSEASHRFTRSVPQELAPLAARRAAQLLCELAGGRIQGALVDAYPRPAPVPTICLTAGEVNRQLGMELSLARIQEALESLDIACETQADYPPELAAQGRFGLHRRNGEPLLVCTPPWHRLDLRIPADLTEEVARAVGYENVGFSYMPDEVPGHPPNAMLDTEERIRDILSGVGLQEIIGYTWSSPRNHRKLTEHAGVPAPEFVRLANPSSPERSVLRRDLLVTALEHLAFNLRFEDRAAVFEIGLEFLPDEATAPFPQERRRLQLTLTGARGPTHFEAPQTEASFDYYDLKGILDTLFERLGVEDRIRYRTAQDIRYGPYCAAIELDGQAIGLAGELHPQPRRAFGLPDQRVAIANLALPPLVAPAWSVRRIMPISPYPEVIEDLAFQVDMGIQAQQVADAIRQGGGDPLIQLELFDIYTGAPLPEGSKSLAYRVTYQSATHSLSEKEIARIRRRIVQAVERDTGAVLRTG